MKDDTQGPLFIVEMGIIQPIYFTVLKCSELTKREIALGSLRMCGLTGIWDGLTMKSITEYVVQFQMELATRLSDGGKLELSPKNTA
jgi:hypothetical protein